MLYREFTNKQIRQFKITTAQLKVINTTTAKRRKKEIHLNISKKNRRKKDLENNFKL